jgi:hypothetical protein
MSINFSGNRFRDSLQYEEFVRKTYDTLISHRIGKVYSKKLYTGKRTGHEHEIDVSIELEIVDLLILILVECKHYQSKVDISDVLEFAQRIDDIGAHKGVMVTTIGYQEGALKVAHAHGIALVSTIPYWRMVCKSAGPIAKHSPDDEDKINIENQSIPITVVNYEVLNYIELELNSTDSSEAYWRFRRCQSTDFSTALIGIIVTLRDKVIWDYLNKGKPKIQLKCSRCGSMLQDFYYNKCANCQTDLENCEFTDDGWYKCRCGKMLPRSNLNNWVAKCKCGKILNHSSLTVIRQWKIKWLIEEAESKPQNNYP